MRGMDLGSMGRGRGRGRVGGRVGFNANSGIGMSSRRIAARGTVKGSVVIVAIVIKGSVIRLVAVIAG